MIRIFIALKNPPLSARFELENHESNGKHDNHYTIENDYTLNIYKKKCIWLFYLNHGTVLFKRCKENVTVSNSDLRASLNIGTELLQEQQLACLPRSKQMSNGVLKLGQTLPHQARQHLTSDKLGFLF
jgi:hypothetical protein